MWEIKCCQAIDSFRLINDNELRVRKVFKGIFFVAGLQ